MQVRQATCRPTEDLPLRPSMSIVCLEIYNKRVIITNKNRNTLQNTHVAGINNGTSFYALYTWRQLYRDSCSINGKIRTGGAAETMLCDFLQLYPELYGERSCTANAHSLTHLAKYVRLWGLLWTHSAFGFESRNGHLKHLFHARSNIVDQLVFNVDLQLTLQLLHPILQQKESPKTLDFLMTTNGSVQRRGMQKVKEHTYVVGSLVQ